MHTMLAGMTGAVELKLEKEEAESLASAIVDVGRFYNMEVPAKAAAWTNLIMVAGALYGPRVMVLNMKRKANKSAIPMPPRGSVAPKAEPAPKGDNGNVIEIPGVGKVVR